MFKRITAILLSIIMALMLSAYKSVARAINNDDNDICSSKIAMIPIDSGDIYNRTQEYLIKRKKQSAESTNTTKASEVIDKQRYKDVTNIAFFGLDARNIKNPSRSDVIMIVSIDKKYEKVKVTSLMRDMYVKIPGKADNRINAAYALGGADLALKTINNDFGLDIKKYVTVDFLGLEKIIDKVGGVEINVKKNEIPYLNAGVTEVSEILEDNNPPCVTKDGTQVLNGRQTVAYARIRYTGNADYERTERQRIVINELLKKIKNKGILKLPGLVMAMLQYVKTNFTTKDIIKLGSGVLKFKTSNIEKYRLPVDGTYKSVDIRGMSVLVPDMDVNKKKLIQFIYESK